MVYVPRLCYPVISQAKDLGKGVIVHLHDYQPISYEADYFDGNGPSWPFSDVFRTARAEVIEGNGATKAFAGSLLSPLNRLSRFWISQADTVICVSRRQAEIIAGALPELIPKLRVIYNLPPDIPYSARRTYDSTVLYLGGDKWHKGFRTFLKATPPVAARYDVKFFMTGNYGSWAYSVIDELNESLNGKYLLVGNIHRDDLINAFRTARASIFSSVWEEPLPYAVMESMLAGVIPIASRVGGVPEMVQGTFAERLLYPRTQASALTERLGLVLSSSREQLDEIGHQLHEVAVNRFRVEDTRRQLSTAFASTKH